MDGRSPGGKRPLNAFMLFMREMRPKVQEECALKESSAINQVLGKRWHELSKEEQGRYYDLARREKEFQALRCKARPGRQIAGPKSRRLRRTASDESLAQRLNTPDEPPQPPRPSSHNSFFKALVVGPSRSKTQIAPAQQSAALGAALRSPLSPFAALNLFRPQKNEAITGATANSSSSASSAVAIAALNDSHSPPPSSLLSRHFLHGQAEGRVDAFDASGAGYGQKTTAPPGFNPYALAAAAAMGGYGRPPPMSGPSGAVGGGGGGYGAPPPGHFYPGQIPRGVPGPPHHPHHSHFHHPHLPHQPGPPPPPLPTPHAHHRGRYPLNHHPHHHHASSIGAVAAMAAGELSGGSMKKCRARFGLEHQNLWCKPCRDGEDMSPNGPLSRADSAMRFGLGRGFGDLMQQRTPSATPSASASDPLLSAAFFRGASQRHSHLMSFAQQKPRGPPSFSPRQPFGPADWRKLSAGATAWPPSTYSDTWANAPKPGVGGGGGGGGGFGVMDFMAPQNELQNHHNHNPNHHAHLNNNNNNNNHNHVNASNGDEMRLECDDDIVKEKRRKHSPLHTLPSPAEAGSNLSKLIAQ